MRETPAKSLTVPVDLPLRDIVPPPGLFRLRSDPHGQKHVARVMVHAFRLLHATGAQDEVTRSDCSLAQDGGIGIVFASGRWYDPRLQQGSELQDWLEARNPGGRCQWTP